MASRSPALVEFIAQHDPLYYGKLSELREQIAGWLSYIPQTFPNYTRHTIEHSEKIILQLSKLLFWEDDVRRPLLELSSVEAYILCASAMLHDSGMVASDAEKAKLLKSEEWAEWASVPSTRSRLEDIEMLRSRLKNGGADTANFIADRELRFLIAEFIRTHHHRRSGDFLAQHEIPLGRFAFDDPALRNTISSICIAHGLPHSELADDVAFPLARDLRGEKTNVRLLAILLRLGDLLDMDADRACPLLSIAGGPVPQLSIAHWSQYQRISHRLTTPERIEIIAECESQAEHRVLLDWCKWIETETVAAKRLLAGAKRHANWHPPTAIVGPNGSIQIRPSKSAKYVPCDWRLDLDETAVLDRFINDLYADRLAFLREVVQNAIDATRCKMFWDWNSHNRTDTSDLFDLPPNFRSLYPVRVTVLEETVENEILQRTESAQVICIEDVGIGMDLEVIKRFFLQVGRSFYRTPAFLRNYPFQSIGRHGVGFLSVFSVSDHIVVDTRHHLATDAGSTRLTLTGPKSYFLRERGLRTISGTTIKVRLREHIDANEIVQSVASLCRRVEVPIVVTTATGETYIEHESPSALIRSEKDLTSEGGALDIRAIPFEAQNIRGELYVFEHVTATGKYWNRWNWARYHYGSMHPLARPPEMPLTLPPIRIHQGIII
jgi:molecular chaperone HtpG